MPYRVKINENWYRRIYCFRDKVSAVEYAERLRSKKTLYMDIQVCATESRGWWCVYGRDI